VYEGLTTITGLARSLGVSRDKVKGALLGLGIAAKPLPFNGRAEGYTEADCARVRRVLGPRRPKAVSA
jgi:hypothetical protein